MSKQLVLNDSIFIIFALRHQQGKSSCRNVKHENGSIASVQFCYVIVSIKKTKPKESNRFSVRYFEFAFSALAYFFF